MEEREHQLWVIVNPETQRIWGIHPGTPEGRRAADARREKMIRGDQLQLWKMLCNERLGMYMWAPN